jgi:hypothetical protein
MPRMNILNTVEVRLSTRRGLGTAGLTSRLLAPEVRIIDPVVIPLIDVTVCKATQKCKIKIRDDVQDI